MQYKFLIYISQPYALPIGEPLETEILTRGHRVMWFSDEPDGTVSLADKNNKLTNIQQLIAYQPDIVLAVTNTVPDFISGIKVQVFHGFNAEKRPTRNNAFSHFKLRGFFDLYCTQGPNTTDTFKQLAKKHGYFAVVETGWSKVDALFPIESKSQQENPVVLIASTFTQRLSLAHNDAVFAKIQQLAKQGTYQFMLVLHPMMPKSLVEKWQTLNSDNFTYYPTTNLIPLFKQADFMFADTTSAIQEFLLQKKPVVAINHTSKPNYLINIEHADEIEQAFVQAKNFFEPLKIHIADYIAQLHPYEDGKSSQRIIDASIEFLHQDKSSLKAKPLNLIRKIQIRKKLRYYTFKSQNKPITLSNKHQNS